MKPVQLFSEFEYVCQSDLKSPEEDQTIFVLKSLTVEQEAYLDDNMQDENTDGLKYGSTILHVLNMGLITVKNFKNGKKAIKFERDKKGTTYPGRVQSWKNECLSLIPISVRREIAAKIRRMGMVEEQESKNS